MPLQQIPPLNEFVSTQAELRELAGSPVVWKVPVVPTWPEYTAWSEATSYVTGDKVSHGGKAYEATANNEGVEPPEAATWAEIPPKTKINEDTGLPYDSTIAQESPEFTEVTKTCLVIKKQGSPLRPQADTETTAEGEGSGIDIIIDIAQEDYEAVEDASYMLVEGLDYKVKEAKPFSIGGKVYRQLVYGQAQ